MTSLAMDHEAPEPTVSKMRWIRSIDPIDPKRPNPSQFKYGN